MFKGSVGGLAIVKWRRGRSQEVCIDNDIMQYSYAGIGK
jgi:hypothetical protein